MDSACGSVPEGLHLCSHQRVVSLQSDTSHSLNSVLFCNFSAITSLNSCFIRAHWYLAVICFPGLKGLVYEQNPLCHSPFQASASAADPPSEESIPDHCRPLSPDRDGLDSSSDNQSPGVPEASMEGQADSDPLKESAAFTEGGREPSNGPPATGNGQADAEQQYTSESPSDI